MTKKNMSMGVHDLVMNSHKGALRFGTIIQKRIDEQGWAQFRIKWHQDEAHENAAEWNKSLGNKKPGLIDYRTDMLQLVSTERLRNILEEHVEFVAPWRAR